MEFADRGADRLRSSKNIEEGTVQYLRETLGIQQVGYRDWITVRVPNAIEADFFKVPPDGRVAMYEIFRTAFDGNGKPMRLTVTVLPADRNQFIVNVGDVPDPSPSDLRLDLTDHASRAAAWVTAHGEGRYLRTTRESN